MKPQRFVVDESLYAIQNTNANAEEELQKLAGFLNLVEPLYKRGSLHSFIYFRMGDLLAGVSSNSRENYERALEHFGMSLDIEPNFAAFAGRGACYRNHLLPNKEQALIDFGAGT